MIRYPFFVAIFFKNSYISMIVVKINEGLKRINYLSREGTAVKVVLHNELKPSETFEITTGFGFSIVYNYFDVDTDTLDNSTYYLFTVLDIDGKPLHKGKIFATDQDLQSYTVNKDGYIEPNTNNDFITFYE